MPRSMVQICSVLHLRMMEVSCKRSLGSLVLAEPAPQETLCPAAWNRSIDSITMHVQMWKEVVQAQAPPPAACRPPA